MYCSKCGQNIPNDSVFCPECGYKCGGNNEKQSIHNSNINSNKYVKYFIETIKHPIITIKQGGNEISTKANLLYMLIIALIIPFVQMISIRDFIMSASESVFNFLNAINGKTTTVVDLMNLKNEIAPKIDTYIKVSGLYKDVYFLNLIHYVLLYGITLIALYVCYKYLVKEKFSLNDFVRVAAVTSMVNFLFVIITSLVLLVSALFSVILWIISIITVITLLVIGLNYVLKGSNKFAYIFPISFGMSIVLTNYICVKYVVSIIGNLIKFNPF